MVVPYGDTGVSGSDTGDTQQERVITRSKEKRGVSGAKVKSGGEVTEKDFLVTLLTSLGYYTAGVLDVILHLCARFRVGGDKDFCLSSFSVLFVRKRSRHAVSSST